MNKVRISVVIFLFGVSTTMALLQESEYGDQFLELSKKVGTVCRGSTGVEESAVEGVKKGNFPENNKKIKSYVRCALNQLNVMDSNGDIHREVLLQILPEVVKVQKTKDVLACADHSEKDLDQKGYNLIHCVHDLSPKDFIFF